MAETQKRRGRPQEAPRGGRGRARCPDLCPVSEAHRVRDQDAGGERQMARRAQCRHSRRDGSREPAAHAAREGSGRALRDSATADGQPLGRTGVKGESPPGDDGFLVEVKPGYKLTEVGVIPHDWEVKRLQHISPAQSVGLVVNPSSYFDDAGTVPMLVGSNIKEHAILWESARRISDESNHLLASSRLAAGDLVTVRV